MDNKAGEISGLVFKGEPDAMSIEKIKNPLPAPTQCDYCASCDVTFTNNAAVYGREVGEWPYCYHCPNCGASVGCHPGTAIPLGRLANAKTRRLRAEAHKHFDQLWTSGAMSREDAYSLIARHLSIDDPDACHLSQMSDDQLKSVREYCRTLVTAENLRALKRRKEKQAVKQHKRHQREQKHNERFGKYRKVGLSRPRNGSADSD
jgi:hypothetical protein